MSNRNSIGRLEIKVVELIEKSIINPGWFTLVHDGCKPTIQGGELPTLFTRKYRLTLDGLQLNTWVKFVYNHRDGWADIDVSIHDNGNVPSAQELAVRKLVKKLEHTRD